MSPARLEPSIKLFSQAGGSSSNRGDSGRDFSVPRPGGGLNSDAALGASLVVPCGGWGGTLLSADCQGVELRPKSIGLDSNVLLLIDSPEKPELAVVLTASSATFPVFTGGTLLGAVTGWFPGFDQLSVGESLLLEDERLETSTVPRETSLPSSLLSFLGAGRHGTPGLNSGGSADSLGPASTPHLLETGSGILVRGETLLLLGADGSETSLVEMEGADTTLESIEEVDCEDVETV